MRVDILTPHYGKVIMKISGVLRAVVATLLMCFSSGPSAAVSGGPTAQIRDHVDEMSMYSWAFHGTRWAS